MAVPDYDIGQKVRSYCTFTDLNGSPIDPTAVFLEYKSASGDTTTLDYSVSGITRTDTGDYYADIDLDAAGWWYGRWYSTGTGQAATQFSFLVAANKAT